MEQIRKGLAEGLTLEGAIDHGISVCLRDRVLTEFLIKHQGEVKLMILTEYNEALHLKDTYHCGYQDGETQGIKIGESRGESRGIKIGESRGIKIGESRGIKIGETRGMKIAEDRLNQFYQYLSSQNRMEDLKRALAEEDFRRELMEEYFSK